MLFALGTCVTACVLGSLLEPLWWVMCRGAVRVGAGAITVGGLSKLSPYRKDRWARGAGCTLSTPEAGLPIIRASGREGAKTVRFRLSRSTRYKA